MRKYPRDVPKFLLMHHSMLSHDAISQVSNADEDLRSLLKRLNDDSFFNDTLVIVLADHGHRYSELRSTQQGEFARTRLLLLIERRVFRATRRTFAVFLRLFASQISRHACWCRDLRRAAGLRFLFVSRIFCNQLVLVEKKTAC